MHAASPRQLFCKRADRCSDVDRHDFVSEAAANVRLGEGDLRRLVVGVKAVCRFPVAAPLSRAAVEAASARLAGQDAFAHGVSADAGDHFGIAL